MKPRWEALHKIAGISMWALLIGLCAVNREKLTPEAVAAYTPGNLWLAALVLLSFFALKSVSIFFYSGILYAASGLLFPLPVAMIVNICGTAVAVTIPYFIGAKTGAGAVNRIELKYPQLRMIRQLREKNDFLFSFAVRAIGILPSDVVSFYMGAAGVAYPNYLAGCLLGMLPQTITFPVMGMNIRTPGSQQFIIALGIQESYTVASILIYLLVENKKEIKEVHFNEEQFCVKSHCASGGAFRDSGPGSQYPRRAGNAGGGGQEGRQRADLQESAECII